jgi:hypothetical protein
MSTEKKTRRGLGSSVHTRVAAVLTCLACVTWQDYSVAQESRPAHVVAAEHFERGLELYREGTLDAALVEFERAYEAVPDFRVLYNLGQIQSQRGEYLEAIGYFERYLREGGESIPAARRAEVEKYLTTLNGRTAKLWVETNVEGAELFVNGKSMGQLPLERPISINSGVCEVRIVKPGYEPRSHQLKAAGGDQPRLSLPLTPTVQSGVVSTDILGERTSSPPSVEMKPNYTPFWISAAATVAFGGAAGAFGYLAFDAKDKMDAELERFPANRDIVEQRSRDTKQYSLIGDIFGAATVVAAGSAVYFLVSPPKSRATEQPFVSSLTLRTAGTSAVLSGHF